MSMISTYLHLVWWLLPPGLVLWWARRWLLIPWARYMSHSVVPAAKPKPGCKPELRQWFITVRHVHWYPPFADFDRTYRSFWTKNSPYEGEYWWAAEVSGEQISGDHDSYLTAMCRIADARQLETEELLKDQK